MFVVAAAAAVVAVAVVAAFEIECQESFQVVAAAECLLVLVSRKEELLMTAAT